MWSHFHNAYSNLKVVQWNIWYAVILCGYLQIITYMQVFWIEIEPNMEIAWNGAVDAVLTTLAALTALVQGIFMLDDQNHFKVYWFCLLLRQWKEELFYFVVGRRIYTSLTLAIYFIAPFMHSAFFMYMYVCKQFCISIMNIYTHMFFF